MMLLCLFFFFFKLKTAYEMRISDWSSDVCSSDLEIARPPSPGSVRFRRPFWRERRPAPTALLLIGSRQAHRDRAAYGGNRGDSVIASSICVIPIRTVSLGDRVMDDGRATGAVAARPATGVPQARRTSGYARRPRGRHDAIRVTCPALDGDRSCSR